MKTLIMHGSFGSPNENWFRWLEAELTSLGQSVILEQFPVDDWDTVINKEHPIQSFSSWEKHFVDVILPKIKGEELNFVGHSIAPIFMLHMMEKYQLKVNAAIFVSPFFELNSGEPHFIAVNTTFYKSNFDFDKIKHLIKTSFVVYGDDDPYVPVEQPKLFAEKLGSSIITVHKGGHCGGIFKKFPLILELIKVS